MSSIKFVYFHTQKLKLLKLRKKVNNNEGLFLSIGASNSSAFIGKGFVLFLFESVLIAETMALKNVHLKD